MRYLVTGGFGFIGSHLVEALLAAGHEVHVVDDLSSNPVPLDVLLEEIGHERLTYDIQPLHECPIFVGGVLGGFDGIFHLASPVGPAGVLNWRGKITYRIIRDADIVKHLAMFDAERLVFVSTSEVYGGGEGGTCWEGMPHVIPAKASARAEYAAGKLAAEMAVLNTDIDALVVRPFNVAGPRQSSKGGFVLARFVEQALRDEALTVFDSGGQRRAFTHVRDVAQGLIAAMERGKKGFVYNLGNPQNRIRIRELAELVIKITGRGRIMFTTGKDIFGPNYEETADKFPAAARATLAWDWHPSRDIDQTIRDAYEYAQKAAAWSR